MTCGILHSTHAILPVQLHGQRALHSIESTRGLVVALADQYLQRYTANHGSATQPSGDKQHMTNNREDGRAQFLLTAS